MRKFIVLDVEGYSTCRPYDVGFKVTDKSGKTWEEWSCAIMPSILENLDYKYRHTQCSDLADANRMATCNIEEIMNDNSGKYVKIFSVEKFFNGLLSIISKYQIKRIWAYNCTFDKKALERLFGEEKFSILTNLVEFCDIIPAILYSKLLCKDYVQFCKKNGFITDKGNVQTKAEVVWKYLSGNLDFSEAHTGLEDVQIETKILLEALNETKSPKRKPCQAWKILREFCLENSEELATPNFLEIVS